MKNKFLALLLVALCGPIKANNDDAAQLAVAFAQTGVQLYTADQNYQASLPSQKNFIKHICWLFKNNPLFYKMHEFHKNMDYSIAVFNNHIETLQHKIESKENGLKSNGMRIGAITATLSTLCAYAMYYFLNQRKTILATGQKVLSLRDMDEEAMNAMFAAVNFGVISLVTGIVAGQKFYNVYRHQERLVERLERDKKILALLQEEKALLEGKKLDNDTTSALNQLIASITDAINGVVQGKV